MTSLAEQDTHELGGRMSVLTLQKADHARLDELLRELDQTRPSHQDPVLRKIYRLVFPHAFAEESVLFPVLRRTVPDGRQLTLQIEQEHQEVNELVTALEGMTADDPERASTLARLTAVLREDVRDEEDQLLPELQQSVTGKQLRRLGLAWEVMRRIAPTRAHPVVAHVPQATSSQHCPCPCSTGSATSSTRCCSGGRRPSAPRCRRPAAASPWRPSGWSTSASCGRARTPRPRTADDARTGSTLLAVMRHPETDDGVASAEVGIWPLNNRRRTPLPPRT
jgi:hypothetical protein